MKITHFIPLTGTKCPNDKTSLGDCPLNDYLANQNTLVTLETTSAGQFQDRHYVGHGINPKKTTTDIISVITKMQEICADCCLKAEQYDLSMLLLKKLYKVADNVCLKYETGILQDTKEPYAKAKTSTGEDVYCIREKDNATKYELSISDSESLVDLFDNYTNFTDGQYDYLKVFYDFTMAKYNMQTTGYKFMLTPETRTALTHLNAKFTNPDLKTTQAWPMDKITIFSYLESLLKKTKGK